MVVKRGWLSNIFVLLDDDEQRTVRGYYTLSNESVSTDSLPEKHRKRIPYPKAPVTLLGRLAIDLKYIGKGFGQDLLFDALRTAYNVSLSIGSIAVVVDPIDEAAIRFYSKYGFIILPESRRIFLPMGTIKQFMEI